MMLELFSKGPFACNIYTTPEFRYYKGGIFTAVSSAEFMKVGLDNPEWA